MFETAAKICFWLGAAALAYAYAGYPVLVAALGRLRPRRVARREDFLPSVSVVITAYNEERDLAAKLENTLALDYPSDKLEIIVASDCSSDRTDEIARSFAPRGVRLHRQAERLGKTAAQNAAVELARGEVILFSDATTLYRPDVLRVMAPNFADPSVGCVAGRLIYVDPAGTGTGSGARSYWGYESFIKRQESRACSLIGVSGCLYAVRRSAYVPLYNEACSDFIIATKMVEQRLRAVYEPAAVCTEETNRRSDKELRMRVRVITQTYTDLWRHRHMLNPLRSGFYGVQLFSHKVLRYLVPVLLLLVFASSLALARTHWLYALAAAAQGCFYGAALASWALERAGLRSRVLALPQYFVLANLASLIAAYKFARGERYARWEPIREPPAAGDAGVDGGDADATAHIPGAGDATAAAGVGDPVAGGQSGGAPEPAAVTPASEGQSLTARTFWLAAAKTLAYAFAFSLPVLLTRALSQTEYGLFKQVFLVVGTATVVLPLGFGMSAYYYLPRETDERRRGQVILNILLFSAAVGAAACLALVLKPELLAMVFGDEDMAAYAPLVGFVILLWLLSSFLEIVVVANQETRLSTVFIVCSPLAKTALMFGAAAAFGTVRSLIYAALAQGLLQMAALLVYLRARFPRFWRSFDWAMLRAQFAYAAPLGAAGLLYTLLMDLHNYVVSGRFDARTFAIYSIGVAQLPLVSVLRESVSSVMLPQVSRMQKRGEGRGIVYLLSRAMRKLSAFYLPIYAFLMVCGREFIAFLFTPAYLDSWPVFAVNLTLLPLSVLEFDSVIRAYAEHRYFMLKLRAVLFALLLVALWFGVLRFGVLGAIGVVVGINLLERVATALKFGRVIGARAADARLLKDVGKVALAAAAAAGAAALTRQALAGASPFAVLAACGAVFGAAYLAGLLLLGVPEPEEREAVRRQAARLWRRLTPRGGALAVKEN